MSQHDKIEPTGTIAQPHDIGPADIGAMFSLMSRYFVDVDRGVFEADLAAKNEVILIHAGDELVGFSTLKVDVDCVADYTFATLFSGDTIVDSAYWGFPVLQRCWLTAAVRAMERYDMPLYWLLICGGYRTYRYLPTFFKAFWPRYEASTPPREQVMLDTLAAQRFGNDYQGGVVISSNGFLREDVSPVNASRLRNPHVAFFQRSNPGHSQGNELVCITRVSPDNLTAAGVRVLNQIRSQ